MSLLGIDIGTTGCKAIAFSSDGRVLNCSYREYQLQSPKPGWYELHGEVVWNSVKSIIRKINSASEVKDDPVKGLSISASGDELVPVNSRGEVLYPTIMSQDSRGSEEARFLEKTIGREKLYKITGLPSHGKYGINRIMWIRDNHPEVYAKSRYFLGWEDFIYFKMGLPPVTDYSTAARFMAFDIRNKEWSAQILEVSGVDPDKLPNTVPSGRVLGEIKSSAAEELGFANTVYIIAGGFDQVCAALGAGVISPDIAMVGTGTMEALSIASNKIVTEASMLAGNYPWNIHVVPNMYNCTSTNVGGGQVLKWYRDNFAGLEMEEAKRTGKDVYDIILSNIPSGPSGILLLPHLAGSGPPYKDSQSLGAILGLGITTKKQDFILGILEGITYELYQSIERIEEETGYEIKEIRAVGGGAKSDRWVQLKADILNRVIKRPRVTEAGCLGAAILAGTGIGCFKSIDEGVERLIEIEDVFYPDEKRHKEYIPYFSEYKKIYPAVKDINHTLFSLRK